MPILLIWLENRKFLGKNRGLCPICINLRKTLGTAQTRPLVSAFATQKSASLPAFFAALIEKSRAKTFMRNYISLMNFDNRWLNLGF